VIPVAAVELVVPHPGPSLPGVPTSVRSKIFYLSFETPTVIFLHFPGLADTRGCRLALVARTGMQAPLFPFPFSPNLTSA